MKKRIIVAYSTFAFRESFWSLDQDARTNVISGLCKSLDDAAERTYVYQVYPARPEYDFLVWSTSTCEELSLLVRLASHAAASRESGSDSPSSRGTSLKARPTAALNCQGKGSQREESERAHHKQGRQPLLCSCFSPAAHKIADC